jgi:pimeloyl-ACP methyl ester carboxylesterase
MKVIFSHGKESGPWGFKIKRLAPLAEKAGCRVESVDYTDLMDPDLRVERLMTALQSEEDRVILVGSSMGAYVSLVASAEVDVKGVFLLAPALYMPGFRMQEYPSKASWIEIVHGWSDDIIPVENSIRYARQADCSLHVIRGDHPLNDSINVVESLFQSFLNKIK